MAEQAPGPAQLRNRRQDLHQIGLAIPERRRQGGNADAGFDRGDQPEDAVGARRDPCVGGDRGDPGRQPVPGEAA